jgi:hypothetical protein
MRAVQRHSSRALQKVLAGAENLPHSGRPFLAHLVGTQEILVRWKAPASVCSAGLLHSIYSTQAYPRALVPMTDRRRIEALVGRETERLVHLFSTLDRARSWRSLGRRSGLANEGYRLRGRDGATLVLSARTTRHLLLIESANVAEQTGSADGGPEPWMSQILRWRRLTGRPDLRASGGAAPHLSTRGDAAAIGAYRRALTLPPVRARAYLDRAVGHNRWAGEPRLLRALCAAAQGESPPRRDGTIAATLLTCWGVAWDKRLPLPSWLAIARRIRAQECTPSDYDALRAILSRRSGRPTRALSGES